MSVVTSPETSSSWHTVMSELSEHFTVVAPDLRACGASDRPETAYDKCTVAADVYALVTHLGLGPIDLVGHDVGTMVAHAYARVYPDEARGLLSMEAALSGLKLETRP